MQKKLSSVVATCVLLALSACSWLPEKTDETKNWPVTKLYDEARDEMSSGQYESDIKRLERLDTNYPLVNYAPPAPTELAYAVFKSHTQD